MTLSDGFLELVVRPEDSIPVELLAFEIARHAHPDLDIQDSMRVLDGFAAGCAEPTVDSVCDFLFVECGFTGNTRNYYDPDNSLLDIVIESRRGIPISLAVVVIAVGSRLGVGFHGIGLPGHFLVGIDDRPGFYIDAFGGGQLLETGGVRALFHRLHGADSRFHESMLVPAGPHAIARRMLGNLDAMYAANRDLRSRLWATTLRAAIPGASLEEEAEVAAAHAALGSLDCAAQTLEDLSERAPEPVARNYLAVAARWRSQLN